MIPRWARSIGTMTLAFAAIGAIAVVVKELGEMRLAAASLPRQLRLARQEGLAVSPSDLRLPTGGSNAAPTYYEAIALLKNVHSDEAERALKAIDSILAGSPTEAEKKVASTALDKWSPALDKALQGSVMERCQFPRDWEGRPEFPELKPLGTLVHLLAGRAVLQGDLTDLYGAARLANHIGADPVLDAELAQDAAIQLVSAATWQIGKARKDEALTLRSILNELPKCALQRRVAGELLRARAAIQRLDAHHSDEDDLDPLREQIGTSSSPQAREAYESVAIETYRKVFSDLKSTQDWQAIEVRLLSTEEHAQMDRTAPGRLLQTLIGPWSETARQSRKAQEKKRATDQALQLLQEPTDVPDASAKSLV